MNIVEIIIKETKNHLEKVAIIDRARKITYGDLLNEIDLLKAELLSKGVSDYKKVALYADDSIEYIIVSLAVLACKGVIVPISPSLAWDEAKSIADKINVDYLISPKKIKFLNDEHIVGEINCTTDVVFIYKRGVKSEVSQEFASLNPAFIRFSSGTTSTSKGVIISHESICERTDAANKGLNITSDDNIVWVLSMSYHFVVTINLFLRKGSTLILCEKEFPAAMFEAFNKNECTFMYGSPFHYRMMINSVDIDKKHLSNLRMAISTAIEFTEKEISKFFDVFGIEISEAYGIIEVGLPFINTRRDKKSRGSVGKILPDYQIQIRDKNDKGVGTIYLKGKGMFDAYYSPWRIREKVLDNGWFNTGDLGFLDSENFLFIKGREKNVINFTGMKIFPEEVEEVLNSYPNIKESFVYGVAHDIYGQLPQADIVLEDEMKSGNVTQELRKFCYNNLASYKVPKKFKILLKIKKTESGKILRSRI